MRTGQDRYDRDDHGGALTDHKSYHGEADRGCKAVFLADKVDQVDASHPTDLFRELRKGGNSSLADAVEIAVDAGMDCCHGDGESDDAKQRGRPLLHQEDAGNVFCAQIDIEGTGDGERHCQKEAGPERAEGSFVIAGGGLARHILGDSGLDAGYGQGEGKGQHRRDELVDAHAFCTEYVGEEDTIKKADKAAD